MFERSFVSEICTLVTQFLNIRHGQTNIHLQNFMIMNILMIHLYSDTYLYVTHCMIYIYIYIYIYNIYIYIYINNIYILYIYILNMYISISIKCVNNEIMRQFHEILTFLRRK